MTCIAGVAEGGTVWMGGDSAATSGYYGRTILAETKVFRKGPFVLGFCGEPRHAQVVRHRMEVPLPEEGENVDHFIVTTFMDAVRGSLEDAGALYRRYGEEAVVGSAFLVGYRGRLWTAEETFQVAERREGYEAIGSGGDLALGALHSLRTRMSPRARVRAALEAAAEFNAGVAPPFHIETLRRKP